MAQTKAQLLGPVVGDVVMDVSTLSLDAEGNKVGIGHTEPDLTLHVNGVNGLPSSSGSTPTGHFTLRDKGSSSTHGMFMGVSNAAPWSSWIQAQDATNNATNYPLLLNPNGGNVGIGDADPNYHLVVTGQDQAVMIRQGNGALAALTHNTSQKLWFQGGNAELGLFSDASGNLEYILGTWQGVTHIPLVFRTGNRAERMRITFDGTVGINNATPDTSYKLDVIGAGVFTTDSNLGPNDYNIGQLTVKNNYTGAGAIIDFRADSSNGTQGVIAKIGGFNTYSGSGYDGALTFSTRNHSASAMAERLRITSNGDVGIGVNNPTVKLHIREAASGVSSYDNRYHCIIEDDAEAYYGVYVPNDGYGGLRVIDGSGNIGSRFDYYVSENQMHYQCIGDHIFSGSGNAEKLRITDTGGLYTQGNAPINTSHHGAIVSYVPTSGTHMYKSIEIGTNVASGNDTGSQIVSRAKNSSRLPFSLLGSWDNNSSMTIYYGGGWGSASRPATRHLWYTNSYMDTAASGNIRMELHADGNLSIGNITPVDTRNTGGIHIQNSRGIAFTALTTTAESRNWRIRNDDMAWGALDFSIGSSNSTWGTTDTDVITRMTSDGVRIRGKLDVNSGNSSIQLNEINGGAVIWMDGANGDFTGGDYFNIMANNSQQLSFGYAGAENIKINTSGQMHLNNYPMTPSVASGSHLKLRAGGGAWGISLGMRASQNDYAYFGFTDMNGTEQIGDIFMQRTAANTGHMVFSTNDGSGSSNNRLKIDSTGKVCISPTSHFASASTNMALSIVNNGGGGGYPAINLTSVASGGTTNSVTGMSICVSDANWNLYSNSGSVHGLGILVGNSSNSGNVAQYVRSDKKIVMGPGAYARLNSCTRADAAVMVAGGGLSIGPKSNHSDGGAGGRYVKGWYITSYSSSGGTYLHLKTSLWAGGSPNGNTQYIMGGFLIEGYRYNTGSACSTERIMFHNWSGSYPGYDRSHFGNWNPGNTVYTSSDGYVTLRLANGSYYGYVIDLIQHAWYPSQDITVTSATYGNSNI
jgi:hypothetical protein